MNSLALCISSRGIHTSAISNQIIRLSRLRVVDNSEIGKQAMLEGKPPYCFHVYNKIGVGHIGTILFVFYPKVIISKSVVKFKLLVY